MAVYHFTNHLLAKQNVSIKRLRARKYTEMKKVHNTNLDFSTSIECFYLVFNAETRIMDFSMKDI